MKGRHITDISVDDFEKRRDPSKHYVYVITVTWSDQAVNVVYRRYSRFFDLQVGVLDKFPNEAGKRNPTERIIPFLPGKIIFGRSHIREVALKRLEYINIYCKNLIQLPVHIAECKEVLEFFNPSDVDFQAKAASIKRKVEGKEISEPVLLEQYVVIADRPKEEGNEVSVQAGEVVEVIERHTTGWWFVVAEDGSGWVPNSYLEKQDGEDSLEMPVTDPGKPYICTNSYQPQLEDEMKMERGSVVTILEKNLDGWWLAKFNDKVGRVPAAYLIRTDTLKGLALLDKQAQAADWTSRLQPDVQRGINNTSPVGKRGPATSPNRAGQQDGGEEEISRAKLPPPRGRSVIRSKKGKLGTPTDASDYVTVADFVGQAGHGLSFKQGQIVKVKQKHSNGWWFVDIAGREGWAPSSYIEKQRAKVGRNVNLPSAGANTSVGVVEGGVKLNQELQAKLHRFGDKKARPMAPEPVADNIPENSEEDDPDYFDFDEDPEYVNVEEETNSKTTLGRRLTLDAPTEHFADPAPSLPPKLPRASNAALPGLDSQRPQANLGRPQIPKNPKPVFGVAAATRDTRPAVPGNPKPTFSATGAASKAVPPQLPSNPKPTLGTRTKPELPKSGKPRDTSNSQLRPSGPVTSLPQRNTAPQAKPRSPGRHPGGPPAVPGNPKPRLTGRADQHDANSRDASNAPNSAVVNALKNMFEGR